LGRFGLVFGALLLAGLIRIAVLLKSDQRDHNCRDTPNCTDDAQYSLPGVPLFATSIVRLM
jgi:hypothetical protein